jgi:FixJ family two-component response regulator
MHAWGRAGRIRGQGRHPASMVHAQHEVVLIEDDAGMRQAIARILSGSGFAIRAFESAEDLLATLDDDDCAARARCLVCDIRLPGMSGLELHRRVGERGATPPWVFITAHDDRILREQAERAGAAYLMKPFEGRALLALVARMVPTPG